MKVTERFFTVPLDYFNPDGEKIRVFARHIVPKAKAKMSEDEEKLPYCMYLHPPSILLRRCELSLCASFFQCYFSRVS